MLTGLWPNNKLKVHIPRLADEDDEPILSGATITWSLNNSSGAAVATGTCTLVTGSTDGEYESTAFTPSVTVGQTYTLAVTVSGSYTAQITKTYVAETRT